MPEDKAQHEEVTRSLSGGGEQASLGSSGRDERRYRAFVSYRHADIDSKVAAAVQSGLERFHVPRQLRESGDSSHIAPVFRDKEELPVSSALGDDIDAALRSADSFVLICSPRTQESSWVAREIDLYLKYHGRDRIFVVLAEGEPADVVPQRLLYKTQQVTDPDGTTREVLVEAEPLACDFRESAKGERRTELTRLAAAILGVSFDSLNRRAQRRRMRIGASIAAVVTAVALGIAGYALWSNARIQENYRQALLQQSQYLTTAAREELDGGDRLAAIELASAALPAEGEDRPFYPDAMQTLAEALHAYGDGGAVREWAPAGLAAKYQMDGKVRGFAVSESERYLAAADSHGTVRVWDLESDELVFEATYGNDEVFYASLVVTDDGLVVLGAEDVIVCYDVTGNDYLWTLDIVHEIEGESEFGGANAKGYCLLLANQEQVVALGNVGAYLIDLHTGEIAKHVSYSEQLQDDVSLYPENLPGGWDPKTERLVINCNSVTDSNDTSTTKTELRSLLIDFRDCSSHVLEGVDNVTSALFVDNDMLVLGTDESDDSYDSRKLASRNSYFVDEELRQASQNPYGHKIVCIDLNQLTDRWTAESTAYSPLEGETLIDFGTGIEGYEDRHVAADCFANVCQLFDLKSGEVLNRWETASSIWLAWPVKQSGANRFIDGMLIDGSAFTTRIYEDAPKSFSNPSFYASVAFSDAYATRLADGVLSFKGNAVYRYADKLEGDTGKAIWERANSYSNDGEYSTACGLLVQEPIVSDEGSRAGSRLSMLDAVNGGVVWSKDLTDTEEYSEPTILGDPTNADRLYLYSYPTDYDEPSRVSVVELSSGNETSFEVADHFEERLPNDVGLLGSDAVVGAHYAVSSIDVRSYTPSAAEDGATANLAKNTPHLAITDLLTQESSSWPFDELSGYGERFSDDYVELEGSSLSPTGEHLLIPIESIRDDGSFDRKASVHYGVLDLDTHRVERLSPELRPDVYGRDGSDCCSAVWADDGACFVAATEDAIAVFDTNGTALASLSTSGRQIVSLCVQDGCLLVVCVEENNVALLAYELKTGKALGRYSLRGVDAGGLSPSSIHWLRSSSSERNPGEICLFVYETLHVVSLEPFGVCQVVDYCAGYDEAAHAFVVKKTVPTDTDDGYREAYYSYPRHSIDDLLQWGSKEVGASAMTNAERQGFGLAAIDE